MDPIEERAYERYRKSWSCRVVAGGFFLVIVLATIFTVEWLAGLLSGDPFTFPFFLGFFGLIAIALVYLTGKDFGRYYEEEWYRVREESELPRRLG